MDFSKWTLPQDTWRELVANFDNDEEAARDFYADVVSMIEEVGFSRAVFVITQELKIIYAMAQYRNSLHERRL